MPGFTDGLSGDEDERTRQWWDLFNSVGHSPTSLSVAEAAYLDAAEGRCSLWLLDLNALFHASRVNPILARSATVQQSLEQLEQRYPAWKR